MNEKYGYLFIIDGKKHVFIIEENLTSAIIKLEKEFGNVSWVTLFHHSIICI